MNTDSSKPLAPRARRLVLSALVLACLIGVCVGVLLFRAQNTTLAEARRLTISGEVRDGTLAVESFSARMVLVERRSAPGGSIWLLLRQAGEPVASNYLPAALHLRVADDAKHVPIAILDGLAIVPAPLLDVAWMGSGTVAALEAGSGSDGWVFETVWKNAGTELTMRLRLKADRDAVVAAGKTIEMTAEELDAEWGDWVRGADESGATRR